jgi:hypothetical protein
MITDVLSSNFFGSTLTLVTFEMIVVAEMKVKIEF